jgi:hypothetical protein
MAASQVKFRSRNPTAADTVRPSASWSDWFFFRAGGGAEEGVRGRHVEHGAGVGGAALEAGLAAAKDDGVAELVRFKAIMEDRVRPNLLSSSPSFKSFRSGRKVARWFGCSVNRWRLGCFWNFAGAGCAHERFGLGC